MEETVDHFGGSLRFAPRAQEIGRRLEGAFPVQWLVARVVGLKEKPAPGRCFGFRAGSDGYAEDRTPR